MYTITRTFISPKQLETTFSISFKNDNKIGQVELVLKKVTYLLDSSKYHFCKLFNFSLFKIPGLSSTVNKIPGLSRPGFLFFKFKDFPGFPGPVRTLITLTTLNYFCLNHGYQRVFNSQGARISHTWGTQNVTVAPGHSTMTYHPTSTGIRQDNIICVSYPSPH